MPYLFFYFNSNICLNDELKMVIIYSNKYLNEDGGIIGKRKIIVNFIIILLILVEKSLKNIHFLDWNFMTYLFFYFNSNIWLNDELKMVIIYSNKYLNEDGVII